MNRQAQRRRPRMLGLLLLVSSLVATGVQAATYYVAPQGGGGCSTTRSSPSGNVGASVACLKPGDTLYFRAGTYTLPSGVTAPNGTSSARITLAGDPQDGTWKAVLVVGSSGGNGIALGGSGSYTVWENLVLDGRNAEAATFKLTGANHVRLANNEIKNGGTQGILAVGASCCNVIVGNTIHDNGTSSLDHGIYLSTNSNVVESNDIYGHTGFAIHNYNEGNDTVNRDSIARNNRLHGNGYGLLMSNGPDQQGYNNLIYNNRHWGIQVYAAPGTLVANNTVVGNGEQTAIIADSARVQNNIFWQNGGGLVDDSGGRAVISNNLTSDPRMSSDYRLQAGSPAIKAGVDLSTIFTTDFEGKRRPSGAFDLGAYAYGAATPGLPAPRNLRLVTNP